MINRNILAIVLILIGILLIPIASAFDFDNTKKVTKDKDKPYSTIEIVNAFGMGDTLAKYELTKNTEACIINCYAEGTADLYSSESIFNGIKFEDIKGRNINYQVDFYINSSEEYEIETPIYKENCKKVFNSTTGKEDNVCTYSLDKINKDKLTKEVWKKYSGEIMPIGNYKWRIAGNIKIGDKVDWITNAFRKDFDEWAWWNSTWQYKQPIQITGDISKNYSIQINVTKTTGMNSDFSDLRLINNTEDGEIPYWIEYNDSNVAYIWFKVLNNKTIYLYYGNPSATTTGNIKDTFIYGDDFNDGAVDSIWTQKTAGGGAISESGTNISLTNALGGYAVIYTNNVSDFGVNVSAAAKFYVNEANGVRGVGFSNCNGGGANPCGASDKRSVLTSSGADFGLRNDGAFVTNGFTIDTDSYSIYEVRRLDTYSQAKSGVDINTSSMNADYFINNTVAFNSGNVSLAIFAEDGNVNPVTFTDWAYVRRYILPEPNATLLTGSNIILTNPPNNTLTISSEVLFNATVSVSSGLLSTATVKIWNSTGGIVNSTVNTITGSTNDTSWLVSNLGLGIYHWGVEACGTVEACFSSKENRSISILGINDSYDYNITTYETSTETFSVNITKSIGITISSANLIWNGTSYPAIITIVNSSVTRLSKSLTIPSPGVKNLYWDVTYSNGYTQTLGNAVQTVNNTNVTICGASPYNVPFLLFTFKDESSFAYLNSTANPFYINYYLGNGDVNKTYLYTNTSVNNPNYTLCFIPPNLGITGIVNLYYSASGYPTRYYQDTLSLTNTTTNKILYLLSSSEGSYSTYQVLSQAGSPISGVSIQATRSIEGTTVIVGKGITDAAGSITFWLNYNYDHTITASKTGYTTQVLTVKPTNSLYTLFLGGDISNASYSSPVEGIYYQISPFVGIIPSGLTAFTFNITSAKSNMVNCKFELVNGSGFLLNQKNSSCTSNAYLTINYNMPAEASIYGRYYVDMGTGYIILEGDANWVSIPWTRNQSRHSIKDILDYLSDSGEWAGTTDVTSSDYRKYEYTKFVLVFIIIALIMSALNISFQYDIMNPGILLWALPIIFFILSGSAGIHITSTNHGLLYMAEATPFEFLNNYFVAFYSAVIAVGFGFATARRAG